MKILFYGAGPLGSLYAARLQESGQEVSVLARGQRLEEIRKHGIVLEDAKTGHQTSTHINVVEKLKPNDSYDLVVVLMRKNQISAILPVLAENHNTPNVLFMCNNVTGPDEMTNVLDRKRVLLGFAGAGGYRKDHVVIYEVVSGRQQPTIFGELDGRPTPRLKQIAEIFKSSGFPVAISQNIDAWLKTHTVEIIPTAAALYMTGIDNYRLARTRDGMILMVRAIKEGYKVLRALGVPITPSNHKIFNWIPEPLLLSLIRRMLTTKTVETVMVGHAYASRDEMKQMVDEFRVLARKTSVSTPAMDRLYTYFDPTVTLIEEGSAQIPMKWSGMWIGLATLVGIVLIFVLILKILPG
jgi:2-dehydropantoate 2-reductase